MTILARLAFNLAGKIVKKKLDGKTHWVVPTVILTEGVHEGSEGPLLYEGSELAKTSTIWNGRPVVVYHPEKGGKNVSAADPEIIEKQTIGLMLNGKYDPKKKKQRVETWIDEEKANRIDPRVLKSLAKGETVEVSTGVFVDKIDGEGVWNSEKYIGKATNFRADHLAILPDRVGACSIKDGAGLFQLNEQQVDNTLGTLLSAGERVGIELVGNELSFSETTRELCDQLAATYGEPGKSWMGYIVEVFPTSVIFRCGYSSDNALMQQDYTTDKNDEIALTGKAVEVERVVSYTANNQTVPTKEKTVTKKELIDQMIANKSFLEGDREMLDGRTVADLERYAKLTISTPGITMNAAPVVLPSPTPRPMTQEEYLQGAPPALRAIMNAALEQDAITKAELTAKILAVPGTLFNAGMLAPLTTNDLRAMASLIQPVTNSQEVSLPISYFGQSTPAPVANQGTTPAGRGIEAPKELVIDWSAGRVA